MTGPAEKTQKRSQGRRLAALAILQEPTEFASCPRRWQRTHAFTHISQERMVQAERDKYIDAPIDETRVPTSTAKAHNQAQEWE